jgi:lipopolysaccharide exporter
MLKRWIQTLTQSTYYRNIGTLISGATLSQVLLIVLTPILSRIYDPDAFGLYAVFLTVITMGAVVATGRYEIAILLPKKDRSAFHLFSGSLLIAAIVSIIFAMVLPFFKSKLDQLAEQDWGWLIWWLPFAVFAQATLNATTFLANRHQRYRSLSVSRFTGSATTGFSSILIGLFRTTAAGLIIGKLLGLVLETATVLRPIWKDWRSSWGSLRAQIPDLLRQYQNFPKYSVPEALLNMGHKQVPIIALTVFFNLEVVGLFSMASTLLSKPIGIVSTAFSQVFYRQSTGLQGQDGHPLRAFFLKNLALLALLILPPTLLVVWLGPWFFALFLGENWRIAGVFAQWLMPYLALNFLKTAFSSLVDTTNKIRESALFEALFLVTAIAAFAIAEKQGSALIGVQYYSLFGSLLALIQLGWFYQLTGQRQGWEE